MSWQFEEIPKRVIAVLERPGIEVKPGESIGAVLARELGPQMGYVVPAGKRLLVSIHIRAELMESEA